MKFNSYCAKFFVLIGLVSYLLFSQQAAQAQAPKLTGAISGRIKNENNLPLKGFIRVYSASAPQTVIKEISSNDVGVYFADNLDAGNYYVETIGSHLQANVYIDEVFAVIPHTVFHSQITNGTVVPVRANETTSGIDFSLKLAKTISGHIMGNPFGSTGQVGLPGAQVLLYDALGRTIARQNTDLNGAYLFNSLTVGSYYVATNNSVGFIDQVYSGQICPSGICNIFAGTRIELFENTLTQVINFSLRPGGLISGTVYNAVAGLPLNDALITVYNSNGVGISALKTNSNGQFLFTSGLQEGTYFVTAQKDGYVKQLFGLGECPAAQTCNTSSWRAIAVITNKITQSIDFRLFTPSASPSNLDSDKDGTPDVRDRCPLDPKKILPAVCGCGVADLDANVNGIIDCLVNSEIKFELSAERNLIKQLKALGFSSSSINSKLTGELSNRAFRISNLALQYSASIQLVLGTSEDLNEALRNLEKSLKKLGKSHTTKKAYITALHKLNKVYVLLS